MERNVLEFVDHLHEHFLYPCSINSKGRYNVPSNPEEGYRYITRRRTLLLMLTFVFMLQYRDGQVEFRRVRVSERVVLGWCGEGEGCPVVLPRF